MVDMMKVLREQLTANARETKSMLRISDETFYAAVARGEIPTTGIGHGIRVPTAFLRQRLGLEPSASPQVTEAA